MSSFDAFLNDPWKPESMHSLYADSLLQIKPAPEVVTGEILLASLYRNVGFYGSVSEKKVPFNGRALEKKLDAVKSYKDNSETPRIDPELWKKIVTKSITSPKQINQSKKQFLQLSPLIPDNSIYSMAARLVGNPWNPGKLIAKMLCYSCDSQQEALTIWKDLFKALSVNQQDDDVWARLLQKEFEEWRPTELKDSWKEPNSLPLSDIEQFYDIGLVNPSQTFCKDLKSVMELKTKLTRRQWISMLESLLRIGSSSHVMWMCSLNKKITAVFESAVSESKVWTKEMLVKELSLNEPFWSLGQPTSKTIQATVRDYVIGRCSINLMFWTLQEKHGLDSSDLQLRSVDDIFNLSSRMNSISQSKTFNGTEYRENLSSILEADAKISSGKKGTSKNLLEFLSHVNRQRQTSEAGLESYDQGFFNRKKGNYKTAPWITGLGPAAVLTMVHCTVSKTKGPQTISDLIAQLRSYGLDANFQESNNDSFQKMLRSLGLVIDSPDAEGGMIINSPFI